jgi:antitoxin component YwqK of YwqJK toxin-antitoxin module
MTAMRLNADDVDLYEGTYVQYEGANFTGEVAETLDDGTVIGLNTYVDGLEDGPQRAWTDDGTLVSEYQAVRGMPVGEAKDWYANGQLRRRQEFDQHGTLRKRDVWDENGVPQPGESVNTWPAGDYPQ